MGGGENGCCDTRELDAYQLKENRFSNDMLNNKSSKAIASNCFNTCVTEEENTNGSFWIDSKVFTSILSLGRQV
jgi:hypothetical protein